MATLPHSLKQDIHVLHPLETQLSNLPTPEADAQQLSEALREQILLQAKAENGISFERFMSLALYSPGMGYYANGLDKFGPSGDFITAPQISPLFGKALANQCAETLSQLGAGDILEFGAGNGRLAADVLHHLSQTDRLPQRYMILEVSTGLRARQQRLLQAELPELMDRLVWLDRLPTAFTGLVIANELIDAMPVCRFRVDPRGLQEQFVVVEKNDLKLAWKPMLSAQLLRTVNERVEGYALAHGYESELNRQAVAWITALADIFERGLVLLIDYGYNGKTYYHAQRNRGTLQCHYRHRVHHDPLLWPGLQDITASVDFSALANAAGKCGFDRQAFTSQANFLLANGIEGYLTPMEVDQHQGLQDLQGLKRLILPNEMGESFKVLGLGKGITRVPTGFTLRNYSL
jgi:SAM-dependent MidA family methyltransferase